MAQCCIYLQRLIHGKESYTANNTADNTQQPTNQSAADMASIRELKLPKNLVDHILGTIFGNCIGDAIGLTTEFLIKRQVTEIFGAHKHFEYKSKDITADRFLHQGRFDTGDWTDDGDQMILILQSLIDNNGKIVPTDFGKRLQEWKSHGFKELGDTGGMGIGRNTLHVLINEAFTTNPHQIVPIDFGKRLRKWRDHGFQELGDAAGMGIGNTTLQVVINEAFVTNPHKASFNVWIRSECRAAPNGGVMRTSILGVHNHHDIDSVIRNTVALCRVTHADPRCVASCVAVTTCIAMMLQGKHRSSSGCYDTQLLTNDAYEYAKPFLTLYKDQVHPDPKKSLPEFPEEDLHLYMNMTNIDDLKLDEKSKIGYTYKCMGSGFWALRQNNFREAIETITREGGDADTNCAVAGALLGCKLGYKKLPKSWRDGLIHKKWLEGYINKYLALNIMTDNSGSVDTTETSRLLEEDASKLTVQDDDAGKADAAVAMDNQDASNKQASSQLDKSEKDDENEKRK